VSHRGQLKHRQQGAVILTVAFTLFCLLAFMAIALDFGRMFVVKGELQTAADACALAAAQELDGAGDAITRATNAGIAAGNRNNVDFQSGTWSGKGKIAAADITFKDAAYGTTAAAASARYAQCQHSHNGMQMWLFQAMNAFVSNGDPAFSSTKNVGALAVATRASAQTACPIPVALKPKVGGTAPNYGFQVGEWVVVLGDKVPNSGEMGWYNLDGSTSASETKKELSEPGYCGVKVADTLGTPGAKESVAEVWNYRFGIYKNADPGPSVNHPDFSGYAYTSTNWRNAVPQDAYAGTPAPGSHPTAANFKTKRLAFASYDDTGTNINDGDDITGLDMKGGYKDLATPNSGGQHQQFGYSRRIVSVPVVNGANQVIDFVCMLMLQPMTSPTVDVQMEFLGNSGAVSSPCTTNGLAGGTAGPLVPVLVQ
jgi:Putative Flp pilus-assembly TadE/G-like